jgi:aspartyl-tRNA(Asn)/glutamyl-tRNA(Gln) amidotransferase subunit A
MSFLPALTIAAALDGLAAKKFSAVELTRAHLDAIGQLDGELNAFITQTPELALQMAQAADADRAAGNNAALCGIPLAIKDLFCTQGVRTTAAFSLAVTVLS